MIKVSDEDILKFRHYERQWRENTKFTSSATKIINNHFYQKIIDMGLPAVILILASLKKQPDYWFYALEQITGVNPVRKADAGNLEAMREVWLAWGRERNLVE